jgi:hypothetical protein
MLRPAGDIHTRRVSTSCFALSGKVSLYQADHVSSEEPSYSTRADSATHAPLLTELASSVVIPAASGLCLLFLVFPVRRVEAVPVLGA